MKDINFEEIIEHLTTLGDWARWAASPFNEAQLYFGHGTDNAWDEAVFLVLTVLHLPPEVNPVLFHATLTRDERLKIIDVIKARIDTRKPLAYLLKQSWFSGLNFYVDERVLVPRSPIAEWVNKQFIPWVIPEEVTDILEIGTGSGCLAAAAAMAFPGATIDAIDIDDGALEVAALNIHQHGLEERVRLFKSDCFNHLPQKQYDIILSNPPYVSQAELARLPMEYQREPRLALCAEDEGLAIVKQIFKQAPAYLKPNGILVVEVGHSDHTLMRHFPGFPGVWLELENGGGGVFLLTSKQLAEFSLRDGGSQGGESRFSPLIPSIGFPDAQDIKNTPVGIRQNEKV